mmetsp:Transcript_39376/g.70554  ORF Transcript_39376/g.70554 Transcript_39376/m.70554 type:complete len:438 (-) Transcript_39376:1019-2332(-)
MMKFSGLFAPQLQQRVHHARVRQRGGVAQLVLLLRRDLAQHAAHDLSGARLGEAGSPMDDVRRGEGADLLTDGHYQRLAQILRGVPPLHQRDVGVDALPLDRVLVRHHSRLSARLVAHQRGLHLRRADPMSGHVDHVVDAAGDPVVAVLVAPRAVAGEVVSLEHGKVGVFVALLVAVDAADGGGPGLLHAQQPLRRPLQLLALIVQDGGHGAEEGQRRAAGLLLPRRGQRRDHVAARLRLPPSVHNGHDPLPDDLVVPAPGLRVDGLAHGAQHAEGVEHERGGPDVALAHEGADGGGRGVKLGHAVLVDDGPKAAGVGVRGDALEYHLRDAVQHGAVREVGVACDPTAVGGAEIDVVGVEVKDVFRGGGSVDHVAAGGVEDALRLAGGARGVEQEQRVLRLHPFAGALGGQTRDRVLPPHIAPLHPVRLLARLRPLI